MKMNWLSYAIAAMVLLGIMNFGIKLFVNNYSPMLALFLVQGISAIVLLAMLAYNGELNLDAGILKYAIPIGVVSALGLYFSFTALKLDSASKVIPIVNLNTLIVVILAMAFLHEKINIKAALGIVFGILSIILLSL